MLRVFCRLLGATLLCACLVTGQLDIHEGSDCTAPGGKKGVCALLYNCPPALNDLAYVRRPHICSYAGVTPVVCCSETPVASSEPETPTRDRTPEPAPKPTPSNPARRISEQKCAEYGQAVFRLEGSFLPGPPENNVSLCAIEAGTPFILGGTPVTPKELPHMAVIGYNTKNGVRWWCGGTLISERFVLTAGHCLDDHSKDPYPVSLPRYVRLGEVDLKTADESEVQEFEVKRIIRHPEYRLPVKYHDIGLIELNKDASFDAYVRPACLQIDRRLPDDILVAGWGKTNSTQYTLESVGAWSENLLKATVSVRSYEQCKQKYSKLSPYSTRRVLREGVVDDWMLCAGDNKGEKDTCQGDSGGPLQYVRQSPYCMYSVAGITSFGNSCGKPDFPAIYTRVSYYVPWIESVVWPN